MTGTAALYRWPPVWASLFAAPAMAIDLSQLTNQDAARGIRGALTSGAYAAIGKLGVPGGFLNNPKVKIPLPAALDEIAKGMRVLGRGNDADELVAADRVGLAQKYNQFAAKGRSWASLKAILRLSSNM